MSSMVVAMMRSFSSGLSVGKSASKDLIKLWTASSPLLRSDEAQEARKKAFSAADPNGNGLCSLAELETCSRRPCRQVPEGQERGKEPGKDLWDASVHRTSRHSAMRRTTRTTTARRSWGRRAPRRTTSSRRANSSFCAYLCIYAAMVRWEDQREPEHHPITDPERKILTNSHALLLLFLLLFPPPSSFITVRCVREDRRRRRGRGGDDRKIDMGEWMAGYKQVKEHGFLGLGKLKNDKEAKEAFNKIDSNGGGEIMLNEWCDYLKAIEIENKTKLARASRRTRPPRRPGRARPRPRRRRPKPPRPVGAAALQLRAAAAAAAAAAARASRPTSA